MLIGAGILPLKTWVMLESRDFSVPERVYMPLNLEGPSSGGVLRIRADLLSWPAPPATKEEPITPVETQLIDTTITLPGGGETTITETQTAIKEPISSVDETIPTQEQKALFSGGAWSSFLGNKAFIAPASFAPNSTFNIWIGKGSYLMFSARYNGSFDISIPINFFAETTLLETAQASPPPTGGGGGGGTVETTFGNPMELGDFGDFAIVEGAGEYPTIDSTTDIATTVPKLNTGYHPSYIEVVTNGNTWRVHVEIEYEYERTGGAETSTDPPIIRNIIVNKSMNGVSQISWNTDVKADRNWVAYGIGSITSPTEWTEVEASTGTLYPSARLTMQDGTWYYIQVFSDLKGRVTNSEPFPGRMPDANIGKTVDLTTQAGSGGGGLIGDGQSVEDIEGGETPPIVKPLPIIPILVIGSLAAVGIGGTAWFLIQRGKS